MLRCRPVKHLLNPHLLSLGGLPDEDGVPLTVPAPLLATPRSFGITFKHIYAQARLLDCQSPYPERQYREHIRCITSGACREDDGTKHCEDDYVQAFNVLLDSMCRWGFNPGCPVPVDGNTTALDGSHRIAAALALGLDVPVLQFSHKGPAYTSAVFSGMDCDRAAVEFCKLRPDARLMIFFGPDPECLWVDGLDIVYSEFMRVPSPVAQDNLITELYLGEEWLGDSATGFRGASPKARPCFARGDDVGMMIVVGPQEAVTEAKERTRAQCGIRDCIHTTDTHEETLRVARVLFHAPSMTFLSRPWKHMPGLEGLAKEYLVASADADKDFLCVDGSAVMARYGLREPADLDFVHAVPIPAKSAVSISSHNEYAAQYPFHFHDLIFDPENYFWSHGVKYASLARVREVKRHIKEDKNAKDVAMMNTVLGT